MATQSSFKQQCPSCEAMVPIRDPKLIGRKIDCPKCKYRFVVEEPVDDVEEAEEDEAPAQKGKATGITSKKPSNGKAAKGPAKRRPDDDEDELPKPKKQGGSGMLIAGIVLAGVAIIALAVGAVFLFTSDSEDDSKPSSSRGPSASSTPQVQDGEQKATQETTKSAEPKPRQEDITNLLPNDTQIVLNLPMEHLLGNSRVNQALLKTAGAFHEEAFRAVWGIMPGQIRRVVLAFNNDKKTVFSVMRTSAQLDEKQIVARLNVQAERPINGLKHYVVKRPFDAFSTFILRDGITLMLKGGVVHHDKIALHFMDQFTVVFADVEPMTQFLQAKGQPKQLSTLQNEEEQGGGGGGGGGPQGGMQEMQRRMMMQQQGGMQGGPPPGMQGAPPQAGGAGAPGGKPRGGAVVGGPPSGGGYQPPTGMPPGMAPPTAGGSTSSGAAPVSSSYMTVDPHLKAVLDQAERVDKNENQNVLLSLAMSTSAVSVADVKKSVAQQGANLPFGSDFAIRTVLDTVKSQLKAVGLAVTDFTETKMVGNVAVGAKDATTAQDWQKKTNDFIAGFLTTSKLDLVAKNPPANNSPQMQAGGGMMGMQGGMMQNQQMQQMQQMQRMRQMQQMQGMQGGPMGGGPMGGFPGAQAPQEGEKQEEKGKKGTYEIWSKDNVLAGGLAYNLDSTEHQHIGAGLDASAIVVRGVTAMTDRVSHIHELAAAMQAYLDANGHFPRGAVSRSPDSQRVLDWRPDQRLSWMTQILPYLASGEFKDVKANLEENKAWYEDQKNIMAGITVIPHFLIPLTSDNVNEIFVPYPNLPSKGLGMWAATRFVGIAGVGLDAAEYRADDNATAKKRGVFGYDRETKKKEITDGPAQTIVLIQVPPEPKSPWIAGGGSTVRGVSEDLDCVQPFVCTEYEGKRGTFAIMADGKVRFIPATINPKTFRAMCTIAGDDRIRDLDRVAPEVPPPDDTPAQPELKAEPAALSAQKPAPAPLAPTAAPKSSTPPQKPAQPTTPPAAPKPSAPTSPTKQ